MAIVATYNIMGATVHIDDSYYANRTPEERKRDYNTMVSTVERLWNKAQLEKLEREQASKTEAAENQSQ